MALIPLGGGSSTTASATGTMLSHGDTTHSLWDADHHEWSLDASDNIFIDGSNADHGSVTGFWLEIDDKGVVWAYSGTSWYSGPAGARYSIVRGSVNGRPSTPGSFNAIGTINYLSDLNSWCWWVDSVYHTCVNSCWIGSGGAQLMVLDRFAKIWVNTAPNWWYWDYNGNSWIATSTAGPETPQGTYVAAGAQICIVDSTGAAWKNFRFFGGAYYSLDKDDVDTGGVSDSGMFYGVNPTTLVHAPWVKAAGNWYYWNAAAATWSNYATPPVFAMPAATGITVGSPAIGAPWEAQPVGNVVPSRNGQWLADYTRNTCLVDASGNIFTCDAGNFYINGNNTGWGFNTLLEYANGHLWDCYSGTWYDYTAGVGPIAPPNLTFPTPTGKTVGSPVFTAPALLAYTILGGGTKTTASAQGTRVLYGDLTHAIYDASHLLFSLDSAGNILANGSIYGGGLDASGWIQTDNVGAIWAFTGGTWFNGPPGAGWTVQATLRPQLTLPGATGIIATASPAFTTPTPKAISNFTIPAWSIGSPAFTAATPHATSILAVTSLWSVASPAITNPTSKAISNLGGASWAGGSPAFTAPALVAFANFAASPIAVGSLAFTVPGFGRNLAAPSFASAALAIGRPAGGFSLAATNLAPAALSIGTVPLGVIVNVGSASLTASPPSFGAPVWGNVLAATTLAVAAPAFGQPALVRVVALGASNLVAGSPAIDAPSPGFNLGTPALTVGSPGIGSATLNQAAALAAPGSVAGSPAIGAPVAYRWLPLTLAPGPPALGAPAVVQTQVLAISAWNLATPELGVPNTSGAAAIGPVGLTPGSPAFPVIGLSQRHGLAANTYPVASPAFGAAVLDVIANGAAVSLDTIGSPAIGAAALAAVVSTAATSFTTGRPAFGAPAVGSVAGGTPLPIAVQSIEFGAPAITLFDNLAAAGFAVGSPSVPVEKIDIVVALAATGKTVASPVLDRPAVGSIASGDPVSLVVAAPAIGVATLAIRVNAAAADLVVAGPALDVPDIGAVSGNTPTSLIVGRPAIGSAAMVVPKYGLAPVGFDSPSPDITAAPDLAAFANMNLLNFTTGRPEVGKVAPQLGQNVAIAAADLVTGAPYIGQQWLVIPSTAASFEVGSPEIRKATVSQMHRLTSVGVTSDHPDLGTAAIGQTYPLVARGITVAPPDQYWSELAAAIPLVTGSPAIDLPSLLQLTVRPLPVNVTGQVTHPGIVGVEDPVTEAVGIVPSVPKATGQKPGTTKVTGSPMSARITGVAEFAKIKS